MQLITSILRGLQAIFAIIVFGISVDLARSQHTDFQPVPAATGYAAFCGGFGIVVALVGIASLFASSLEGIITWALDGLSALTMLAAGIAYTVLLRNTSCSNPLETARNSLVNGGCDDLGDDTFCWYGPEKWKSRCTSARADSAFMFISFVTCLGVVGYSFFVARGGRGGSKGVSYA
ncbi:MARVEL domain-containing protein [Aspergillus lucknowensis]|uniref:Marvel domain-containing protein n=1 Tax=Aspergillus lucknowensis TaxID=176173 RepID=A0ABR4LWK5_9EURO